jgi:hypothetical protein|tara:strand:- start:207 stop:416 length:210 start_codon:yes stop_codon:yes gene_type:complete
MSHYTVGYHDLQKNKYEICEYATSAYDAIEHSKEDVSYLREHPHSIDYCSSEEVNNISRMMAAGIPMGH